MFGVRGTAAGGASYGADALCKSDGRVLEAMQFGVLVQVLF